MLVTGEALNHDQAQAAAFFFQTDKRPYTLFQQFGIEATAAIRYAE